MIVKDKVIIIAGVGPGMGQKLALLAASEGAQVAIAARNKAFLDGVARDISKQSGRAIAVPCDVTDSVQCQHLAAETEKVFGRIDALVNLAYSYEGMGAFEEADLASWRQSMDVTCFGGLRMAQAVLPAMKRQHKGAIVNVSTIATRQPLFGQGAYAIAKSALNCATRQLASELGSYGIRVNTVLMGWMWGAPVQGHIASMAASQNSSQDAVIADITENIPLGVIPPDEECAKSALFLASDYSAMVTGAALDCNGGEYMPPV